MMRERERDEKGEDGREIERQRDDKGRENEKGREMRKEER